MARYLKYAFVLALFLTAAWFIFLWWASVPTLPEHIYVSGALLVDSEAPDATLDNDYTIVTYNVGYASGLKNNTYPKPAQEEHEANLDAIVAALNGVEPDVIAFQEIDFAAERSYDVNQLTHISLALDMKFRGEAYNWDVRYLPFPGWRPWGYYGRVVSGQAIASRFPITAHAKVTLPQPENQGFLRKRFYLDRLAQIAQVAIDKATLTIINVHLEAWDMPTREAHADIVSGLAREYDDGPVILLGDFNATPQWVVDSKFGDPTQPGVDLSQDPTITRILEKTGFSKAIPRDAYEGDREREHYTYPSDAPSVNIDHIFYNRFVKKIDARVLRDAGTGSDHLPVMLRFRL